MKRWKMMVLSPDYAKALVDLYESVVDLFDAFGDLFNLLGKGGAGEFFAEAFIIALNIVKDTLTSIAGLVTIVAGGIKAMATGDFSMLEKGFKLFADGIPKGLGDAVNGTFGKEIPDQSKVDPTDGTWRSHGASVAPQDVDEYGNIIPTSYSSKPRASWSSFKNSIPGVNTDTSSVDWGALKKGFIAFMNSIPKEFGNISKGLFQTAKGYGGAGDLAGVGSPMSYLYPQATSSGMSQISMKQNYYIYGATNPDATAKKVSGVTTASLTRHFQGGNR